MSEALVIGLTGRNAAGKGEIAAILARRGFRLHSLSDIVREEARRLGRSEARDDLIATGVDLRKRAGPGILAKRLVSRVGTRDVVDSIRHPAEVGELRRIPGFLLVAVEAPLETRYERAKHRTGRGDALSSLDAFRAKEQEEDSIDPNRQQLQATIDLADVSLRNDTSLADLETAVAELLSSRRKAP